MRTTTAEYLKVGDVFAIDSDPNIYESLGASTLFSWVYIRPYCVHNIHLAKITLTVYLNRTVAILTVEEVAEHDTHGEREQSPLTHSQSEKEHG